jgi:hypothetical protein
MSNILELPSTLKIYYCVTAKQCIDACEIIINLVLCEQCIWGFDCEWKVDFRARSQCPVALIQIATENIVFLFHITSIGMPECLINILTNKEMYKVGVNIKGDMMKLERDFSCLRNNIRSVCDLRHISLAAGIPPASSLAGMVEKQIKKILPKPNDTRCSNWEIIPLTSQQIMYAALDGYASYIVMKSINEQWLSKEQNISKCFMELLNKNQIVEYNETIIDIANTTSDPIEYFRLLNYNNRKKKSKKLIVDMDDNLNDGDDGIISVNSINTSSHVSMLSDINTEPILPCKYNTSTNIDCNCEYGIVDSCSSGNNNDGGHLSFYEEFDIKVKENNKRYCKVSDGVYIYDSMQNKLNDVSNEKVSGDIISIIPTDRCINVVSHKHNNTSNKHGRSTFIPTNTATTAGTTTATTSLMPNLPVALVDYYKNLLDSINVNKGTITYNSKSSMLSTTSKFNCYELWHAKKMTLDNISIMKNIKLNTVISYILLCIEEGYPYVYNELNIDINEAIVIIHIIIQTYNDDAKRETTMDDDFMRCNSTTSANSMYGNITIKDIQNNIISKGYGTIDYWKIKFIRMHLVKSIGDNFVEVINLAIKNIV